MKPVHLFTIAIILLVAACWSSLNSKNPGPVKQPPGAESRKTADTAATPASTGSTRPNPDRHVEINWASIAAELRGKSRRLDKLLPSPASQKAISQLSRSELLKARRAVLQSNIGTSDKSHLLRYLNACLVRLDPEGYLRNKQGVPSEESSRLWWERYALAEWTRLSPEDALNWFNNDAVDSRDEEQIKILGNNLFSALFVVDFEKAKAHLLATPEQDRFKLVQNFDGFGVYWRDEDFNNHDLAGRYAEIARLYPPVLTERLINFVMGVRGEQDRPCGISLIQESLKDWDKGHGTSLPATTVADFLDKIHATPEERDLCFQSMTWQLKYYHPDADQDELMTRFTEEVGRIRSQ